MGSCKHDNECNIWGSHSINDEYWTFWDVMPCPPANSYWKINYISADVTLTPQKNWIFMILSDHISIKGGKFLEHWSNCLVLKGFVYGVNTVMSVYLISFYTLSGLWVPESVHCWLWQWYLAAFPCINQHIPAFSNGLLLYNIGLHPQYEVCQSIHHSVNQTHKQCYKLLFWYFTVYNSAGTRPTILNVLLFSGQD